MAEFPALPLWTDAYLGDTTHLTTLEHGAYLLLLMAMWRNNGSLPSDDVRLSRSARVTMGQWRKMKPTLMEFFTISEGRILQGRLTDELEAVRQKSKRQKDNAKARWLKNNETDDATASEGQSQTDASLTLTLTHEDSVPKGTGADAPPDADPWKAIFAEGKKVLTGCADPPITERTAGGIINSVKVASGDSLDEVQRFVRACRDNSVKVAYPYAKEWIGRFENAETAANGSADRVNRVVESLQGRFGQSVSDVPGGNDNSVLPAVQSGGRR